MNGIVKHAVNVLRFFGLPLYDVFCEILHSSFCTISDPGTFEDLCSPAMLASSTNLYLLKLGPKKAVP
jgi:hypothetical protein